MNEEEKEAIEELKRTIKNSNYCDSIGTGQIEILLNYIDKLQKELKDSINARFELQRRVDKLEQENKELNKLGIVFDDQNRKLNKKLIWLEQKNKDLEVTCNCSEEDNNCLNYTIRQLQKNSISKDKIKEALGDENIHDEMILTYIETLVSENNRLEDRKVQIEYNNVFNKGVKSVEDKIRTKIKELEEKYKKHEKEGLYGFADKLDIGTRIDVLKELLGDE